MVTESVFEGLEPGRISIVDGEGGKEFILYVESLFVGGGSDGMGIEGMIKIDCPEGSEGSKVCTDGRNERFVAGGAFLGTLGDVGQVFKREDQGEVTFL